MQKIDNILDRDLRTIDDYIKAQRDWIKTVRPTSSHQDWWEGFSHAIEELGKFVDLTGIGDSKVHLIEFESFAGLPEPKSDCDNS